jgi:hypothetical protein
MAITNGSSISNAAFRTHSFLIQNNGKKPANGSSSLSSARESKVFVLEVQSNCSFESKLDSIVRLISAKRTAGNSYPPLGTFQCCGFKIEILPRASRPVHIPYSPGRQMKVQSLYAIRIRVTQSESLSSSSDAAVTSGINSTASSALTLPKLSGPFLASSSSAVSAAGISAFNQLQVLKPSLESVRHSLSDSACLATQCTIGPFTGSQIVTTKRTSVPSFRLKPSILCSSKTVGVSPAVQRDPASSVLPTKASTPTLQHNSIPTKSLIKPFASSSASSSGNNLCESNARGPTSSGSNLTIAACFSLSSNSVAAKPDGRGKLAADTVDLTGDGDIVDQPDIKVVATGDERTTGVGCELAVVGNRESTGNAEILQESIKTGSQPSGSSVRLLVPHDGPRPVSIRTSLSSMPQLPPGISTMYVKLGSGKLQRINIKDWNDFLEKRKFRGQLAVGKTQTKIGSDVRLEGIKGIKNTVSSMPSDVAGPTVESNNGVQSSNEANSLLCSEAVTSQTSVADVKASLGDQLLNLNRTAAAQQDLSGDAATNCSSSTRKLSELQDPVEVSTSVVGVVSVFH